MKHWTKAELKSAKVVVNVQYKMGGIRMSTFDLILKPFKMESEDLGKLIEILEKYGKTIIEENFKK